MSCVFSIFDAGGIACVCTRTHTHTAHWLLDVSPGDGTRHLEGPKNPEGLNLGIYVFVYVYKEHICTYIVRGAMRSGLTAFFSLTDDIFRKSKANKVNAKPRTRIDIESELQRPSIKGTRLLIVIQAIIISKYDYLIFLSSFSTRASRLHISRAW